MSQTVTATRHTDAPGLGARFVRSLTGVFNPAMTLFAGRRLVPIWGIVRHRGRRSGREYLTPIALQPTPDGLVIPLPFGADTDWCRNVRAAKGCVVRWKGEDHRMVDPVIVDATAASAFFPQPLRALLGPLGIKTLLRMRFAA